MIYNYVSSSPRKTNNLYDNFEKEDYNKQLINTLKDIIDKIDTKILITNNTEEDDINNVNGNI